MTEYKLPMNDYGETELDIITQRINKIAQTAYNDGYEVGFKNVHTIRAWLTMEPITKRQQKIIDMVDNLINRDELRRGL